MTDIGRTKSSNDFRLVYSCDEHERRQFALYAKQKIKTTQRQN